MHLLDYTVGGPDFLPRSSGSASAATATARRRQPTCSHRPRHRDRGTWQRVEIGGRDEVHGESGDDTVYTGGGHDVIYGDAQDDDLIGGWGNDWISGGTGQDGILGDDGRIFTSRNTGCTVASTAVCTQFTEPLYGIVALRTIDPDTKTSHGDVLDEFIYTPGQVQTATINVAGAAQEGGRPHAVQPRARTRQRPEPGRNEPLFDANNSDDIIFGGWGDDFLHGGSGDDAISRRRGARRLRRPDRARGSSGYAQHFNAIGDLVGLEYTDFTRPYNPGDLLHFGADTNPWHANNPIELRLGEFSLYDEYDPRRAILFNAAGEVWGCTSYSPSGHTCTGSADRGLFPNHFFLNNDDQTGNHVTACIAVDNQGNCTRPRRRSTPTATT